MSLAGFSRHLEHDLPRLGRSGVLIALSGGGDSVALLHLLYDAARCARLEVAHVHHGVRGAEADDDAEFCRQLCGRLGLPFHLARLDAVAERPDGLEAAWRRLRYRALVAIRRERGLDLVATGHQRDDVAEGVLVQLLRGAGPRAMAGIRVLTPDGVVRPLLPFGRQEIRSWLLERGLSWREDSSNANPDHLRARVRHQLLPALELASPRVRDHLAHLAGVLAHDEAAAAAELARLALWVDPWHPDGGVAVVELASLAPSLRSRWLHAQAERAGIGRVSRAQLAAFSDLLERGAPRAVSLGRRWTLRASGGRLWLEPPRRPAQSEFELRPTGEAQEVALALEGWRLRLYPGAAAGPATGWWRPVSAAGRGLVVRSARPGERVAGGGPRVADLLALRIPRHLRTAWPVCCEGDRITWIPGVWQDVAPGKPPTHVLEVTRT